MKGICTKKIGMTRVICPETGKTTPVTVLQAPAAKVLQVKTLAVDGYQAAVLGAFERKNFGKNENKKYKVIREVALDGTESLKKGDMVSLLSFEGVTEVTLEGVSKGRGFSGVIKRHNFSRGPETHGSHHHREPGSSGACAKPGKIIKGKKQPGQYGNAKVTLSNVDVVSLDLENDLIAVKGGVPGAKNGYIFIQAK